MLSERCQGWGPHTCPFDEDYQAWTDGGALFVRGHRIDIDCTECDTARVDAIFSDSIVFACNCSHHRERVLADDDVDVRVRRTLELQVGPQLHHWRAWGSEGVEAAIRRDDEGATIVCELEGTTHRWRVRSPTFFTAEGEYAT